MGQSNEQPTTTARQGKAATTASERYRLELTKMLSAKRSSAGNNVLFNALITQLRDEFKTKGRGRRVESSCTRGSTFGLKYSYKWYENVKTRRVVVVLEVACGTRGVARVAKRTQ